MIRATFLSCVLLLLISAKASAVAITDSAPNLTVPTVTNWSTGWGASGITGWDYVGQVGASSGVYLGNGWVLTAAHVGAQNFTLDGKTYAVTSVAPALTSGSNTADLTLFKISTTSTDSSTVLNLPSLVLNMNAPAAFANTNNASKVVLIGYGGGSGESWGQNTVTFTNWPITPSGFSQYTSNDFLTVKGSVFNGSTTVTNNAMLEGNDSGGGDFIYDSATGLWTLAGINEVIGTLSDGTNTADFSGFVQLNTYESQIVSITGITAVPEPKEWMLLVLSGLAIWLGVRRCKQALL